VLGLGLIMVHVYYDFASQGGGFRVVCSGVLGLGLIMVYCYYDFALQRKRFRVV
jgi:hypothetical protein